MIRIQAKEPENTKNQENFVILKINLIIFVEIEAVTGCGF